jgi:hypothetical protein
MQIENFYIPNELTKEEQLEWREFYNNIFKNYKSLNTQLEDLFEKIQL